MNKISPWITLHEFSLSCLSACFLRHFGGAYAFLALMYSSVRVHRNKWQKRTKNRTRNSFQKYVNRTEITNCLLHYHRSQQNRNYNLRSRRARGREKAREMKKNRCGILSHECLLCMKTIERRININSR